MECRHNIKDIQIASPYYRTILCEASNTYKCILSKLVEKIENGLNNNNEYDLHWFKKIWCNTIKIYISNSWQCAFNHLPMTWILRQIKK